jgi:hypothetical protein
VDYLFLMEKKLNKFRYYFFLNYVISLLVMNFLKEFWNFLKVRKKFWLWPIILLLLSIGGLLVVSSGSSLTPFIYAIF